MKILVITMTYPPSLNGVAISTKRTVEELRQQGHTVTVIMPKNTKRKKKHPDDLEIASLPNLIQKDYPLPLPLSKLTSQLLRKKKYDLVHFHQPVLIDGLAKTIAKKHNIPLVFTYHTRYEDYAQKYLPFLPEQLLSQAVRKTIQKTINQCDALIATTKTYEKWLKKKYRPAIYYVSTAGLSKSMKIKKSKKELRKKHNIPLNKTVLLNVSRQAPEKNLKLILKTLALLPNKYYLVMVGDGMVNKSLKQLSEKLGIEKRVMFTGSIPQGKLGQYYSLADFFIYSSMTDTIGINILEAMSAGLPVFAVKDPNVEEVVEHNINGIIIKPSVKLFSKAIQQFPQKEYSSFSTAAKTTATQFLISNTTKKLVETYQTIIDNKKHA